MPPPPVFGRSVNPISSRRGHIIPTQYYKPPGFLDLATALHVSNLTPNLLDFA